MRSWLVSVAGAIVLLLAPTAASPARADEPAFQRFASKGAAHVSANLQAVWTDFGMSSSEAKGLGADIAAALNDGTGVRAVTFVLILVIAAAGQRQYRRRQDEEGDNEGSGKTRAPATPVATLFPLSEGNRNSSEQADYNEPADADSDRPSEVRRGSDRGNELRENDR